RMASRTSAMSPPRRPLARRSRPRNPRTDGLWQTPAMTGVDLETAHVATLIQQALGPVFLISGVGITLSMLTARLARIVDRARTLEDRREATTDQARIADIDQDLRYIVRRTRYINGAIILSTLSAFFTALVVTLLFASAFLPLNVGILIAI